MTAGGWMFLVTCWAVLIALTFYCFRTVLSINDKNDN